MSRWPLILIFLSGIGFSIQGMFVKVLSDEGFDNAFQIVCVRGITQAFLMLCAVVVEGKKDGFVNFFGDSTYVYFILFLRCFFGVGGILFAFLAILKLPLGDASVLVMMSPLYAAMLSACFLGEPWRLSEKVGVIVALIGGLFVVRPPFLFSSDGGNLDPVGVFYGFCASICAAVAFVTVRMLGTTAKLDWRNVSVAQGMAQATISVPVMYLFGFSFGANLTARRLTIIIICALVGTISQACMTYGMQREKSAVATATRMSDILFGFIWQAFLTNDKVSILSVLGAIIVSASIGIMIVFKDKPEDKLELPTVDKTIELAKISNVIYEHLQTEDCGDSSIASSIDNVPTAVLKSIGGYERCPEDSYASSNLDNDDDNLEYDFSKESSHGDISSP